MEYVAFDSHKYSTLASADDGTSRIVREWRIGHERGTVSAFLAGRERGSPAAVLGPSEKRGCSAGVY